jgi:hypothetical protein
MIVSKNFLDNPRQMNLAGLAPTCPLKPSALAASNRHGFNFASRFLVPPFLLRCRPDFLCPTIFAGKFFVAVILWYVWHRTAGYDLRRIHR